MRLCEEKYKIDFTIIDLNPGLSAINQNMFLASDAFIVPTNPDPFSLMALETLKSILPRWVAWKRNAQDLFSESAYPLTQGIPKFLGTLIQRFNIRKGKAAKPYRENIDEINERISNELLPAWKKSGMALLDKQYGHALIENKYCLGEIPDFQGLLPKAFAAGVPVFELTDSEIKETGPVFEQLAGNRERFKKQFDLIAKQVTKTLAHA